MKYLVGGLVTFVALAVGVGWSLAAPSPAPTKTDSLEFAAALQSLARDLLTVSSTGAPNQTFVTTKNTFDSFVSSSSFERQVNRVYDSLDESIGDLRDDLQAEINTLSAGDISGLDFLPLSGGTLTGAIINSATATSSFAGALGIGTATPTSFLAVKSANPVFTLNDSRNQSWTVGEQIAAIDFASDDTSSGGFAGKVRARIAALELDTFGASQGLAFYTTRITDGILREYMRLGPWGDLTLSRDVKEAFGASVNSGPTYLTIMGSGGGDTGNIQLSSSNQSSSNGIGLGNIEWHNYAIGLGTDNSLSAYINVSLSGTTGSTIGSYMSFATKADGVTGAAVERMRLDRGGNLGIGTSNPGQKLTVAGSVGFPAIANGAGTGYLCITLATGVVSTSTSACNPSSLRFKDNVQELSYGLDDLLALNPVSFTYKPELLVNGNQVGFIAEELADILPEAVGYDQDGKPYNVDYGKTTPLIVKAVQELWRIVSGNTERIEALEAEVAALRAQVNGAPPPAPEEEVEPEVTPEETLIEEEAATTTPQE